MIYLDHNATTPILAEVLEAMMPYLTTEWGNPSSSYKFGSKLKAVIETARAQVAELIGAHQQEIIFTSCGTESNNAAIHAALKANPGGSRGKQSQGIPTSLRSNGLFDDVSCKRYLSQKAR